jgi:hypothetical protein
MIRYQNIGCNKTVSAAALAIFHRFYSGKNHFEMPLVRYSHDKNENIENSDFFQLRCIKITFWYKYEHNLHNIISF